MGDDDESPDAVGECQPATHPKTNTYTSPVATGAETEHLANIEAHSELKSGESKTPSMMRVLLTYVQKLTGRVAGLEAQLKELQDENKVLHREVKRLREEINRVDNHETQLTRLTADVERLQEEIEAGQCGVETQREVYSLLDM